MKPYLFSLLFVVGVASAAGVQKWTDSSGKVHYGDQPPANTKTTPVKSGQSLSGNLSGNLKNTATSEGFYGIPLYSDRQKVEQTNSDYAATMRFVSSANAATVINFYQQQIKQKYKYEFTGGTAHFSFKIGDVNKLVTIDNYQGQADVTLVSEK